MRLQKTGLPGVGETGLFSDGKDTAKSRMRTMQAVGRFINYEQI